MKRPSSRSVLLAGRAEAVLEADRAGRSANAGIAFPPLPVLDNGAVRDSDTFLGTAERFRSRDTGDPSGRPPARRRSSRELEGTTGSALDMAETTSPPIADPNLLDTLVRRDVEERFGRSAAGVVLSPYRICPLGAHSDHQGGVVLGMAITAYSALAFAPADSPEVVLVRGESGAELRFDLRRPLDGAAPSGDWGDYARGCAALLAERLPEPPRGLVASVRGSLPGAGLSSSASVDLAYLAAFSAANSVELDAHELAILAMRVEQEILGLSCGLLDPATIVGARRHHLLRIDCRSEEWEALPPAEGLRPYRILIAFSGQTRALTATGFNDRVGECREAARRLGERLGRSGVERLGDLPLAGAERELAHLPPRLARRARHFTSEARRVAAGVEAWRAGDLGTIGRLMDESCRSSIESYECGSPAIVDLHHALAQSAGVLGNRFSGGGYGGCCVALVQTDGAEDALVEAASRFHRLHPELAERSRFFLVDSEDGVRLR